MRHDLLALASILCFAACGDDPSDDTGGTGTVAAQQIDSMGRPAVSMLLIGAFNPDQAAADDLKERFNTAELGDATFVSEVTANLATYDGLDGACGNQLPGATGSASRDELARLLLDDQLLVNSDSGTCTTYLSVETSSTDPLVSSGCGGRTPLYDVMDAMLSLFIAGDTTGVTDNVASDDASHNLLETPFLAEPPLVGVPTVAQGS